jgi:hypothetical protein
VSRIPIEARDGLMRAWLEILRERHPEVGWVSIEDSHLEDELAGGQGESEIGAVRSVLVP